MSKTGNGVKAWSMSRYNSYTECPYKFNEVTIKKVIPFITSPAMERGKVIHKLGEDYLNGDIKSLPVEYKKFSREMQQLRKNKAITEERWAFDSNWNLISDYFHPKVWLRVTIDVHDISGPVVPVIDFKTGKAYDGYDKQIELYNTSIFAAYEGVEKAVGQLWYLDYGIKKDAGEVSSDQFAELKKLWYDRTRPMFHDKKFLPKPNQWCSRCPVNKKNGGTCTKG